jgi:hypothetical protein
MSSIAKRLKRNETLIKYRKTLTGQAIVLIAAAKRRCKARAVGSVTIGTKDVVQVLEVGRCQFTGIPFQNDSRGRLKPSLDRIDSKNYNYDKIGSNVRVVCLAVNQAFNVFTEREAFDVLFAMSCKMRHNIEKEADGPSFLKGIMRQYKEWGLQDYSKDLEKLLK